MSNGHHTIQHSIQRERLAAVRFLRRAAAALIRNAKASDVPFQQHVLLIPHLHAARDVARALRDAAGASVLILPHIHSLRAWADRYPVEQPIYTRSQREALLYRVLAERGWLEHGDLWSVCGELGQLFDDLTRERVPLPARLDDFVRELAAAYRGRAGAPLTFEARLVHELWSAFSTAGDAIDAETAYLLRLRQLADAPPAPLHVMGVARFSRAEQQFFADYARRMPVHWYEPDLTQSVDGAAAVIAAAWPATENLQPLRDRAVALRSNQDTAPLTQRVRIAGASSPEHEAQIVDYAVRRAVLAGKKRIGVVVQDRLVARRARALLERAGVLVEDEAGWTLSTTSAATVVARWLDLISGGFYHQDLFDFLKLPFAFGDWGREQRQAAVWRLEQAVREQSIASGIDRFLRLAEEKNDAQACQMLLTMQQAARSLERRRAAVAHWLRLLLESFDTLGVSDALRADVAGEQIMELLGRLGDELADERHTVSFGEWRRWLARELEQATFRDRSISSPVTFTYLAATSLRQFDAAVIVGADASHLPGPAGDGLFFNQSVRAQLQLPTRSDVVREMGSALTGLLTDCPDVTATWQCTVDGEENLLSPLFERLEGLHHLACGQSLHDTELPVRAAVSGVIAPAPAPMPAPVGMAQPRLLQALVPKRISATGYNMLLACPYQFYASRCLRLDEVEEVKEGLEKRDYGELIHGVLAAFHALHPLTGALSVEQAVAEITALSEEKFGKHIKASYLARAWLERWRKMIPLYVEWQCGREQAGWRFQQAELDKTVKLTTPAGRTLELRGRIDRVDADADGGIAVIDYKTQSDAVLKRKAEADGEDIQLPFYALLWGGPVASALFLGLDREGVKDFPVSGAVMDLAARVEQRLGALYDDMANGTVMPAHGAVQSCAWCQVDGLCRRLHWT